MWVQNISTVASLFRPGPGPVYGQYQRHVILKVVDPKVASLHCFDPELKILNTFEETTVNFPTNKFSKQLSDLTGEVSRFQRADS